MAEQKKRRVLLIGGPHDGKWRDHHEGGHEMRLLKTPEIKMPRVFSGPGGSLTVEPVEAPPIEYEVYFLERIALYGEGIWVGLHKNTLYEMDKNPPPHSGWRDAHTTMILRAILQRDVATEMGL